MASSRGGKKVPLIDCPKCGARVIKIKSKKPATYDQVFFKCPNNIQDDPTTCSFICSEEQYVAYVSRFDGVPPAQSEEELNTELNCQVLEMKVQIQMAFNEIQKLRMQISEVKQQNLDLNRFSVIALIVLLTGIVGVWVGRVVN